MLTLERALTSGNYSPAVQVKALKIFQVCGVRPDPDYPQVFWVASGTERGREYRVELYQYFASCSCKHGQHSGSNAVCAHPLAAMTYRKERGLESDEDSPTRASAPVYPAHFLDGLEAGYELPEEPF